MEASPVNDRGLTIANAANTSKRKGPFIPCVTSKYGIMHSVPGVLRRTSATYRSSNYCAFCVRVSHQL